MPNPKDMTGQVFERLTVREKTAKRSNCGSIIWLCDCSCGNTTCASSAELTKGAKKSCGCIKKENMRAYQYKDLTRKTFGRLHVIRETQKELPVLSCGNADVTAETLFKSEPKIL